jgi:hypothetical protein
MRWWAGGAHALVGGCARGWVRAGGMQARGSHLAQVVLCASRTHAPAAAHDAGGLACGGTRGVRGGEGGGCSDIRSLTNQWVRRAVRVSAAEPVDGVLLQWGV